jgi:PhoH-like ATPase
MKKKTFVLDTNVLVHDEKSIFAFDDNDIVIPLVVLEELDTFKKDPGERGHNVRAIIRELDSLREIGSLSKGIKLSSGGTLKVVANPTHLMEVHFSADNTILACAKELGADAIVVTKDINLRVKADALDIAAEDYETDKVASACSYKGWDHFLIPNNEIQATFSSKNKDIIIPEMEEIPLNQFVHFQGEGKKNLGILGIYKGDERFERISDHPRAANIKSKNLEQAFALAGLLDDTIPLMTLQAKAGAGKTLLCIAAAIEKVLVEGKYDRIIITRPVMPVGKDIGFLPGDLDEKMAPWMKPIQDNINVIKTACDRTKGYNNYLDKIDEVIEIAPLTYIRGRSLQSAYVIVDESQNLTPSEVKTLVTRVGEDSKMVLTGDTAQIDSIFLDKYSNGLSYVVDRFKGNKLFAHVELIKSERSRLAEAAANIL